MPREMRKSPGSHLGPRICLEDNGAPSGGSPTWSPLTRAKPFSPQGWKVGANSAGRSMPLGGRTWAPRRWARGWTLRPQLQNWGWRRGSGCLFKRPTPRQIRSRGLVLVRATGVHNQGSLHFASLEIPSPPGLEISISLDPAPVGQCQNRENGALQKEGPVSRFPGRRLLFLHVGQNQSPSSFRPQQIDSSVCPAWNSGPAGSHLKLKYFHDIIVFF